jgi:hypothetical protein
MLLPIAYSIGPISPQDLMSLLTIRFAALCQNRLRERAGLNSNRE